MSSSREAWQQQLQQARLERDLRSVAASCDALLASGQAEDPDRRRQWQQERLTARISLADPQAEACLAAMPLSSAEDHARRCLMAMRLAQRRYRFAIARALVAPLLQCGDDEALFPLQREGLRLAQQLALMDSDLEEARRLGGQLSALHQRQEDPARRREAGAEPWRQWRLEIGTSSGAARLARTSLQQPTARTLEALVSGLEQEPQATALAFALLLHLRRSGRFASVPEAPQPAAAAEPGATSTPGAIPPRLWLLRRHGRDSPELEMRLQRWQALHPGWSAAWIDHQPEAIEAQQALPELVRQACLGVNEPAIRGDLLRLAQLWQHGGVAVDWCQQPLQGLSPLLMGKELVLVQDPYGSVGSELIAATPRHPFVAEALRLACRNVLEGQGYSRWDLSGACLLSGVLARQLRSPLQREGRLPSTLRVLSAAELLLWLGHGASEPPPPDISESPVSTPLNRRHCDRVRRQWGQHWPALEEGGG